MEDSNARQPEWPAVVALSPRLDRAILERLGGGDFEFLCEVVQAFSSELSACICLKTPTVEELRKIAHTLKASAHYVGAIRLSRMAHEVEATALTDSADRLVSRWRSMQEEARGLDREIRSFLVIRGGFSGS